MLFCNDTEIRFMTYDITQDDVQLYTTVQMTKTFVRGWMKRLHTEATSRRALEARGKLRHDNGT